MRATDFGSQFDGVSESLDGGERAGSQSFREQFAGNRLMTREIDSYGAQIPIPAPDRTIGSAILSMNSLVSSVPVDGWSNGESGALSNANRRVLREGQHRPAPARESPPGFCYSVFRVPIDTGGGAGTIQVDTNF
jgi:hypothetical protein